MHDLVEGGSQLLIATHSPILMAYPGACICGLDEEGLKRVRYEDTEHVQITRDFPRAAGALPEAPPGRRKWAVNRHLPTPVRLDVAQHPAAGGLLLPEAPRERDRDGEVRRERGAHLRLRERQVQLVDVPRVGARAGAQQQRVRQRHRDDLTSPGPLGQRIDVQARALARGADEGQPARPGQAPVGEEAEALRGEQLQAEVALGLPPRRVAGVAFVTRVERERVAPRAAGDGEAVRRLDGQREERVGVVVEREAQLRVAHARGVRSRATSRYVNDAAGRSSPSRTSSFSRWRAPPVHAAPSAPKPIASTRSVSSPTGLQRCSSDVRNQRRRSLGA
ncbi:MAG: hypothetical protein SangKO_044330 [Sandaracinaceae bacterium]